MKVIIIISVFIFGCASESKGAFKSKIPKKTIPLEWGDTYSYFDFIDYLHLADIAHYGLFIDFGTPARYKYTMGNWKTGWGRDIIQDKTTFTQAISPTCRLYFPREEKENLLLLMRIQAKHASILSLYLNNKPIARVSLEPKWKEYEIKVDAKNIKRGENYLLFRFFGWRKRRKIAAHVDYIRIIPEKDKKSEYFFHTLAKMRKEVKYQGRVHKAISVHTPVKLSYYTWIPAQALLGFGVGVRPSKAKGSVIIQVQIQAQAKKPSLSYRKEIPQRSRAKWHYHTIDLKPFQDEVVKIEFIAESKDELEVSWALPRLLVPKSSVSFKKKPPKHIVLLVIDALRADYLPFYGNSEVKVPVLERLAQEGIIFESALSPENWTKPSIATLLTSLHPSTHQTQTFEAVLSKEARLISEVLKGKGFKTAAFVANGHISKKFGFIQGWDHWRNFIREGGCTDAKCVFKATLQWIERNYLNSRFFVYIHTNEPHVPYDPPKEYLEIYYKKAPPARIKPRLTGKLLENIKLKKITLTKEEKLYLKALYKGEISYHDKCLGQFLEGLKKLGILDDTLIVITADHGDEFFEHGSVGHGHTLYQEIMHVPLIFWRPGLYPKAKRIKEDVGLVDVMPTILEAVNIKINPEIEGKSLYPFFTGTKVKGPFISFGYHQKDRIVAKSGPYKIIVRGTNTYLFNLKKDPKEKKNLKESLQIGLRYMRILLGQFIAAPIKQKWSLAILKPNQLKKKYKAKKTKIDPELCEQLAAMGYVIAECK